MRNITISFLRLLNLEAPDVAALMISGLLGFMAWFYMPRGPWSGSISVLVSYHLFFAWLLINADHDPGTRLPVFSSILTHLACLAVVCGIATAARSIPYIWMVQLIPGFAFLRYGFAAFAVYERDWLLSNRLLSKARSVPAVEEAEPAPPMALSAEDYQEWLRYLTHRNPVVARPGTTVKAEYERWVRARAKGRTAFPSASQGD